jgi:hypothetical protein
MIDLILAIIFFGCTLSLGVLVARKMPVFGQIPRVSEVNGKRVNFSQTLHTWIVARLKQIPIFETWLKDFSYTSFLQKFLSKVRVMMLKMEHKTGSYLEKLRVQAKEKQEAAANDNYWSDLKNLIKNKESLKGRPRAAKRANTVVEKVAQIKSEPVKVRKGRRRRPQ